MTSEEQKCPNDTTENPNTLQTYKAIMQSFYGGIYLQNIGVVFFSLFFFLFMAKLWLLEVPRLGAESEVQL